MARQPNDIKTPDAPPRTADGRIQRRKLGRIIRDDRHTTTMEWALEDSDAERVVLQILEDPAPHSINGFQASHASQASQVSQVFQARAPDAPLAMLPYDQPATVDAEPDAPRRPKDLRKHSEWIKLTRKLEAAQKGGDGKKRR
jgi:hypothetical protein